MKLDTGWKTILRKAWSIRLIVLAGVLSGVEVVIPYFDGYLPHGVFAALSTITVASAFVARIVAQKDVP